MFARPALMILVPERYWEGYLVVGPVALSYAAYGLYSIFAVGINVTKKTIWAPIAVILGGIVNIIANFILIPRLGIEGAAIATLISYLVLPIGMLLSSQRYYHIPYDWSKMLRIITSFVAAYAIYLLLVGAVVSNFFLLVVLALSMVVVYLISLFVLGVVNSKDVTVLLSFVRNIRDLKNFI